jgi:hypothetical protein
MKRAVVLPLAAVVAMVACQSDRPLAPNRAPTRPGISAAIMDGGHGANPNFFFLPPMVKLPSFSGVFNPHLAPVVTICADLSCTSPIATFTTHLGPLDPRLLFKNVQVFAPAQAYFVFWNTARLHLSPLVTYRLKVSIGSQQLGFADIQVVTSFDQWEDVFEASNFVPLLQNGILAIVFRIEGNATCAGQDDCVEQTLGPSTTEQDVVTPGGFAAAAFPAGYFTQTVTLTIHRVPEPCFTTPYQQFDGCYSFATSPVAGNPTQCQSAGGVLIVGTLCARVEVCVVLSESTPNQQLALFRSDPPASPTEVPGAADHLIHCSGFTPTPPSIGLEPHGMTDLAGAAWHRTGNALGRLFEPQLLYAASAMGHLGLGGLTCCFSNFGWALPLGITTVTGDHQTALAGTAVEINPQVRVQYLHGFEPFSASGITVTFTPSAGGSVNPTTVTTGANGIATTHWTLGTAGPNVLVVTTGPTAIPDTIHATATSP